MAAAQLKDTTGRDMPAPPRNVDDVLAVLEQYKPDPAAIERLRAAVGATPPSTENRQQLANFYHRRARAHSELGDLRRQTEDLKLALDYVNEGAVAGEREGIGRINVILGELATAEELGGNLLRAIELRKRIIARAGNGGAAIHAWQNLSWMYANFGDMAASKQAMQATEKMLGELRSSRSWLDFEHNWKFPVEIGNGHLLSSQGNYGEAERRYRNALVEAELEYRAAGPRAARRNDSPEPLGWLGGWATAERSLAVSLRNQGRVSEAESYARSSLLKLLQAFGRYSPRTARGIQELAAVVFESGRFDDAAKLAQAAIESYEKSGTAVESVNIAGARAVLGAALVAQGRYADAIPVFQERDRALASDPAQYAKYGGREVNWGIALIRTGQTKPALAMLERIYRRRLERGLDENEYFTAQTRGFYAMALAAAGRRDNALTHFRAAIPVLIEQARGNAGSEQAGIARHLRLGWIIESYVRLLLDMRDTPALRASGIDPVAEAFRITDAARGSAVQRALAASAARATLDDPALSDLARREQDAQQRIGAIGDLLNRLLSLPPAQQSSKIVGDMRRDLDGLRAEHAKLRQEMGRRFPDYAELIDPRPATMAQAQASLRTGEALVSIYVGAVETYVWALPASGAPAFAVVPLGEKDLARKVASLRLALDVEDTLLHKFPEFDLALSHELYQSLLKPVEAGWGGAQSLMVVPHKALGQLPFSVMTTEKTASSAGVGLQFSGYRNAPWLLRRAAVTQLPSTSTLIALRKLPAAGATRREFIGFGDPLFSTAMAAQPEPEANGAALRAGVLRRNLSIARVATEAIAQPVPEVQTLRNAPMAPAGVSNSSGLAQLARLPDTADEVRGIARVLKSEAATDVFLGRAASEKNVKSGELANRRVIVFATHGLVPGDLNGLIQPALALSAPEVTGNGGEDGLLTLDEILSLKLNADWVVLSACNTASGDGVGGEAVSGLGRAFFFAGARSLLVSNWPVETVSARLLTTQIFERQAADQTLSRAEALRRTMLDLLDKGTATDAATKRPAYAYAHPMFWAPFSLVGDGGGK
jgi:CHAT domain-containing protein